MDINCCKERITEVYLNFDGKQRSDDQFKKSVINSLKIITELTGYQIISIVDVALRRGSCLLMEIKGSDEVMEFTKKLVENNVPFKIGK